jgi:hypothetical protein
MLENILFPHYHVQAVTFEPLGMKASSTYEGTIVVSGVV